MSFQTGRRGFLGMLATAPVVGPAVAKDAALKMGLGTNLPGLPSRVDDYYGEDSDCSAYREGTSYLDSLKDELKTLLDGGNREVINRQARVAARVLDPDLAASRSMSPTVAYHIQVDREFQRIMGERRKNLTTRISDEIKSLGKVRPEQFDLLTEAAE